ncbi:MAG: penicillin-binding protein 2 [Patescibacteria group bacterium]
MKKSQLPFIPELDEGEEISVKYGNPYEWVESSFIEGQSHAAEFMGRTITDRRLNLLFACFVAVILLFAARSAYFQLFKGNDFALLAERNKTRVITTQAHRGILFDLKGRVLVRNIPDFAVALTPIDLDTQSDVRSALFATLSSTLGIPVQNIEQEIARHDRYQPFLIVDHISYETALKLEASLQGASGIELVVSERRLYEMTPEKSISHIIGYTGRISDDELQEVKDAYTLTDTIGKIGLELSYEDALRGIAGKREVEVDALGHEKGILSERPGKQGRNIVLTFDWEVQKKAEEILGAVLKKFNKKRGVLIATDPSGGQIRAYVSLPSYDSNMFANGIRSQEYQSLLDDKERPLLNRGTGGEYPSGSTIKMLVAAAALQEHIVTKATTVLSSGGIRYGAWFFPDWKAGGHGKTNVIKALAESVNTYFYSIGGGYQRQKGLGVDLLVDYFRRFGIGEQTHVDFQEERSGFLPTPEWKNDVRHEPWYIGDTYHISIGQGDVLVTPFQVNAYTAYFAQKGVSYHPHIVQSIAQKESSTEYDTVQPIIHKKDIVGSDVVATVREGLRAGVLAGSSRRLLSLPVDAAGKTGTAQWSSTKPPHAWFTGWAPYEKPELVLTVLIEEGEEGSRTAMSVASDLLNWYFREYKKLSNK